MHASAKMLYKIFGKLGLQQSNTSTKLGIQQSIKMLINLLQDTIRLWPSLSICH